MAGKFIVFEGIDGAGSSTAVEGIKKYLIENGTDVFTTKEPTTESEAGRKIKKILKEAIKIDPIEFQILYAKDRKEHLEKQIIPALNSGKTVLSARYFFSTYAFGVADGANVEYLMELNRDFLYPDLIFLLKVRAKTAIKRIDNRGNPKELFEKEEILIKVAQAYDSLAQRFRNFKIINAEKSKEEVLEEIKKYV